MANNRMAGAGLPRARGDPSVVDAALRLVRARLPGTREGPMGVPS